MRVPGSKSVTNRALLLAALAGRTLDAARRPRRRRHAAPSPPGCARSASRWTGIAADGWRVQGGAGRIPAAEADVYCAEAGTAARFLLAACAAGEGRYRLDAAPQLRRRPLAPLLEALRAQGARTEPPDADRLPLTLEARGLAAAACGCPATPRASSSRRCSWRRRSGARRWSWPSTAS